MVPETGLEPATLCLGNRCSVRMSYSGEKIYVYYSISRFISHLKNDIAK